MSPRESVARALADTCMFGGLNESYGVSVSRAEDTKGKSYWSISFAKARTLDGAIWVYSPNFILVRWQPGRGNVRFTNEYDAKRFIMEKFIHA